MNISKHFAKIDNFFQQRLDKSISKKRHAFSKKVAKIKTEYIGLSTDELLELRLQLQEATIEWKDDDFPSIGIPLIAGIFTLIITIVSAYVIAVPGMAIAVATKGMDYNPQPNSFEEFQKLKVSLVSMFSDLLNDSLSSMRKIMFWIMSIFILTGIGVFVSSRRKIYWLSMLNRRIEVINMILVARNKNEGVYKDSNGIVRGNIKQAKKHR